jgi:predicted ATP-grasp superfamily ATP-dependent carboligase
VGPVGVDLVQDDATGELLVCEINPRFTTSYVGARALSQGNLMEGLLNADAPCATWSSRRVEFDAAGRVWNS